MRILSHLVLAFIVVLNLGGCSVNSLLFEAENAKPTVIIEYPPNRITYGGHFDDEGRKHLTEVIKQMQKSEYKDYHHLYPLGASLDIATKEINSNTFNSSMTLEKK